MFALAETPLCEMDSATVCLYLFYRLLVASKLQPQIHYFLYLKPVLICARSFLRANKKKKCTKQERVSHKELILNNNQEVAVLSLS